MMLTVSERGGNKKDEHKKMANGAKLQEIGGDGGGGCDCARV